MSTTSRPHSLHDIFSLIKNVAKALGEESEFAFEMTPIDAPIAFSLAQVGTVQQIDVIVPMKLITSVKEVIEKQMGGGGKAFDEEEEEEEGGEGKDDKEEGDEKDEEEEE